MSVAFEMAWSGQRNRCSHGKANNAPANHWSDTPTSLRIPSATVIPRGLAH
jgi:hypothetical protein